MSKAWFRVDLSIKIPGKIRPVTKSVLVPDDLLSAIVTQGNDHRQDAAVNLVAKTFQELYAQAHQKKQALD